ncbi:MAG: DNA polymerase III subunit beta [Chlamydiae bacterium]|nr:DNA polymerase III subunit beta [Chlamydiota bacterium]
MKLQVNRTDLTQLIGKIQSIVPTKPSIPILANILLEAKEDQLVIAATDLTVSMKVNTKAIVEEEGAITLPARRLFQLIRELTSPQVDIRTSSPEVAMINSGDSNFRIQGTHKSQFPAFPDLSEGFSTQFEPGVLKEMLTRTSFAAARDDSREVLNGVLMNRASTHATFTGTDGKLLARNRVAIAEEASSEGSFILPIKAVEEIVKILDGDGEAVSLILMDEKLGLEVDSTLFITKLISGQYPDVSRVIPQEPTSRVVLHRDELITLLRQVSLFTSENEVSARFVFSDGALQISAMNGELGEGKVNMPVNYTGPNLEIAFHPQSFLDILRNSKDETVNFDLTDSYTPCLITDSSEAEFVIMPMHIDD